MSDINQVITFGIGTPSDIPHFILFGLSPTPQVYGHVVRPAGLDAYATASAGLDAFATASAGLDAFGTGTAGLDAFAEGEAGLDDVR